MNENAVLLVISLVLIATMVTVCKVFNNEKRNIEENFKAPVKKIKD